MNITIFGPNLRDQSKGTFVVHATGCADCGKLSREQQYTVEASTYEAIADDIYSDMIAEGSMTTNDAMQDIHFSPCVKLVHR